MLSVLRTPGALRSFLPALLGRSALSMAGLMLLLSVQQRTDSFSDAGIASAAFGIANVLASPWRARAVDRWGQRLSLTVLATAQATSFIALAIAVSLTDGLVLFTLLAVAAGATAPPLGASMRVIWTSITTPGEQRTRALSLDAVAEELLFVAGPVIAAWIFFAASASAGMIVTATVLLVGTVGLTTSDPSRALRGRERSVAARTIDRPLRRAGFPRVLVVLTAVGCVLGVVEIAAPALATDRGIPGASGWLLAAFALGSAVGGILYGHLRWRWSLTRKLFVLSLGLGLLTVAISRLDQPIVFAVALVVLGSFLAPLLITGYLIADEVSAPAARTEASAWVNTAVNFGASLASAVAGVVIDRSGVPVTFVVVGMLAVAVTVLVPRGMLQSS